MRAIQPPQHGWEKISLMNSGCEGSLPWVSFSGRGKKRGSQAATWQSSAGRVSSGLGFPAGVKQAPCYVSPAGSVGKATVWRPHPRPALGALCLLGSFRQTTPVYKTSFYLNPCPSCEHNSSKWGRATTRSSFNRDFSVSASELNKWIMIYHLICKKKLYSRKIKIEIPEKCYLLSSWNILNLTQHFPL